MNGIPKTYKNKPLVFSWEYRNADGLLLGIVGRYQDKGGKKDIVPYFNRKGENWTAGIELNPKPLFGLEKLAKHPKSKAVFIPEGEKKAAALQGINICAVSSLGGANSAKQADWMPLNDYKMIYLLPDKDEPGEHYIQDVYCALMALPNPPKMKIVRFSGLQEKGDVVDWLINHAPDWDGLQPFPTTEKEWVLSELHAEVKKAEPVPESWKPTSSGSPEPSGFDWEIPNEIETKMPPVQALQPELIPEPLKPWLADVSHRMQTPGDFAAATMLTIASSLIGAGCSIKPKRLDDWAVIPNLWASCIGRPSVVLKTPSMKEPVQLLERLQAEYGDQFEKDKAGNEFDALASKAMIDDVKGQLSKAGKGEGKDRKVNSDDIQKLKADYMQLSESSKPEPTRRLLKTNETSIQSMTVLQAQNPRGILVIRDELTGLLVRWDTEQGSDERAYFLEGWNGNGSYTDFKIGRGLTDAPSICISLIGGIQPDKLRRYLYQALKGNNDGLLQRLQLAVWPDEPQAWELIDTEPNKVEKQRAFNIMKALAEMDFIQYGAVKDDDDKRPYFRFDDAGQEVFNNWLTDLQTIKIKQEEAPLMVEHLGKYRSLMPSLALIFHCIEIADGKAQGNVSSKAAQLAVDWCKYLETHARRIYAMVESPEHAAAVRLAGKIKTKSLPSPFTTHDVYHKGWHGLKDRQEVEAAIEILMDENWLMMHRKPRSTTGRPPARAYYINLKLFENT